MDDSKQVWSIWQRLLMWFGAVFTRPGWVRFAQWICGTVLCDEQHTITQEVTSLGMIDQWRNWEHFAEYGAFDQRAVEDATMRLVEQEHPCRFGRYRPAAVDDTKELRSSDNAWGVCKFKHVSSRNPKHPKLVRAHNWVIMGDLAPGNGQEPWTYLPNASRLYMREKQLPAGETFRTKNELAAEMLRQLDQASEAAVLGIFDGGYARAKVVRPCLGSCKTDGKSAAATRRIRLLDPSPIRRPTLQAVGTAGGNRRQAQCQTQVKTWRPPPHLGPATAVAQKACEVECTMEKGTGVGVRANAQVSLRCKSVDCRWAVSGPDAAVRVYVFEVEGYSKPWFIVTSALDLSAAQVLEAYTARFRQEDAIRDHKQRLGMEEVRAWTKAPVLRTFTVQQLSMTLMRLLQWQWAQRRGEDWCPAPPWNRHKTRVSILDLRRLLWRHRHAFSQFLQELDEVEKRKRAAA